MFWFLALVVVSLGVIFYFIWPEIKKITKDEKTLDEGREKIAQTADNISYQLVSYFYKILHFLALGLLTILRYVMFLAKIITGKLEKRFGRLINILKGKEPWHNKKGSVSLYLQQLDSKK